MIYIKSNNERQIDISDLYRGYFYIYGLNIYGLKKDLISYLQKHFSKPTVSSFMKTAVTSENWKDEYFQEYPLFKNNRLSNIQKSNWNIVRENFRQIDILIVGAGTAACCLVDTLNKKGKRIVVVDPGSLTPEQLQTDPIVTELKNFFKVWKNPTYTSIYGITTEFNRTTPVSQVLNPGGCSLHNGTVAVKPTQKYLKSLGPYFENVEIPLNVNIRTSEPSLFGVQISTVIE